MKKQDLIESGDSKKAIQIFKRVQLKNGSEMELVPFENIEVKIKELKKDRCKYFEVINIGDFTKNTYSKSLFTDNYVVKNLNI